MLSMSYQRKEEYYYVIFLDFIILLTLLEEYAVSHCTLFSSLLLLHLFLGQNILSSILLDIILPLPSPGWKAKFVTHTEPRDKIMYSFVVLIFVLFDIKEREDKLNGANEPRIYLFLIYS
jgi:hypothetical protein